MFKYCKILGKFLFLTSICMHAIHTRKYYASGILISAHKSIIKYMYLGSNKEFMYTCTCILTQGHVLLTYYKPYSTTDNNDTCIKFGIDIKRV